MVIDKGVKTIYNSQWDVISKEFDASEYGSNRLFDFLEQNFLHLLQVVIVSGILCTVTNY